MADNIKQAVIETDAYDEVLFSAEPNAYRRMHDGMIDGDLNKGYASFGLGISFIHQIDPIDKVVDRIYSGVPEEQR